MLQTVHNMSGGNAAHIPFRQIWCCDFEFRAEPGERPSPVCMVGREFRSGRELRLWREDLLALRHAPFDTGPDSVFVAYYASAELGCFLELGWPLPLNVLDLFAEHRVETNGLQLPCGNGLIGALAARGIGHIDAGDKDAMRRLVLERAAWSPAEQSDILDYCASDVAGLVALLPSMARSIDWPRALLRGRYMAAVAVMERNGIPVDLKLLRVMEAEWDTIKDQLVRDVDASYGVYDGTSFRADWFQAWLDRERIGWPRHPSGAVKTRRKHLPGSGEALPPAQPAT